MRGDEFAKMIFPEPVEDVPIGTSFELHLNFIKEEDAIPGEPYNFDIDAHMNGSYAGYIMTTVQEPFFVNLITLSDGYKRRHIGTLLLRFAIAKAFLEGCKKLYLKCKKDNKPAVKFYTRLGMKRKDTKDPSYYEFYISLTSKRREEYIRYIELIQQEEVDLYLQKTEIGWAIWEKLTFDLYL
jgi:ribosomal protein S18 acetylase RimI-like enzyme